jgi:riboflavin synthase
VFTGLIEEIGSIGTIQNIAGGIRIEILCNLILQDIAVNNSIAVDGVCLTATEIHDTGFRAEAVGETLKKSVLNTIRPGNKCNLERALKLSDRLGGHLVQGHVNGIAEIVQTTKLGDNYELKIKIPDILQSYVIDEGSIALNGISLTIARVEGNILSFSIIPHTWQNTTLQYMASGHRLNVETDVIAKYIEKLIQNRDKHSTIKKSSNISEEWLKNKGFY